MSQLPENMVRLPEKWIEFLRKQPETGMGYQVVSVKVRGGGWYEKVVVLSSFIAEVYSYPDIPFHAEDIEEIIVTHDKWKFS